MMNNDEPSHHDRANTLLILAQNAVACPGITASTDTTDTRTSATGAICITDNCGRIVYGDETICRLLGYERYGLRGQSVFDIAPDISAEIWQEHWQHLDADRTRSLATRLKTANGELFQARIDADPVHGGGTSGVLVVLRCFAQHWQPAERPREHTCAFRLFAESTPDTIARYDRDYRRLYANRAFAHLAGVSVDALLGKRPSDSPDLCDAGGYEEALSAVFASGEPRVFELCWPAQDGTLLTSLIHISPEFARDGSVASVLAVGRDISEARIGHRRLQRIETVARIGHWQWDFVRKKATISDGACRIFGHPPGWQPSWEELMTAVCEDDRGLIRQSYIDAFRERQTEIAYPHRIVLADRVCHWHTNAVIEYGGDGAPVSLCGTTQDVSKLKHYESRLHEVSFRDPLTGLPNREYFSSRLEQSLSEAERQEEFVGLLLIDLDRFKEINDSHGHEVGDSVLFETAERLKNLVRSHDTVARLGGDEFAVIATRIHEPSELGSVANKILSALARPFNITGHEFFVSASIGISVSPSDANTATRLLQYADSALYDAKGRGRAGFRFYSADLTTRSMERARLESALRRAEPNDELALYYQPKIDMNSGCLIGAEALLRWHHPELGVVTPDRFIKIAEDSGLIVSIGAWVLTQACLTARRWNEDGGDILKIAVNLSSRQFYDDDLLATVCSILATTNCRPQWLEFEITESVLLNDNDNVRSTLRSFRELGISIAIDDFGTGYSSLGYLKRFPIDVLKIDRSFTCDVSIDKDSTELVKAIVSMARSLRLKLVAEGIETDEQAHFLHKRGCHFGQGYLYGKPMSRQDFEARVLTEAQAFRVLPFRKMSA